MAQSPLSQFLEEMKEITLRVPDDMVALIEQWAERIPEMEVVCSVDSIVTEDVRDLCAKAAFETLLINNVIRRPRDYAWIKMALDQNVIPDFKGFYSDQNFIDYLQQLGIERLPGRTTLYDAYSITLDRYPDWTFTDNPDADEALRRKNVVKQFLSAYGRAKREKANSNPNK